MLWCKKCGAAVTDPLIVTETFVHSADFACKFSETALQFSWVLRSAAPQSVFLFWSVIISPLSSTYIEIEYVLETLLDMVRRARKGSEG